MDFDIPDEVADKTLDELTEVEKDEFDIVDPRDDDTMMDDLEELRLTAEATAYIACVLRLFTNGELTFGEYQTHLNSMLESDTYGDLPL